MLTEKSHVVRRIFGLALTILFVYLASEISPIKRRNKQPKALSRKAEAKKKKKVKTSIRRTKCSNPGLNCFYQTNDHWKLPPLWTGK